MEEHSLSTFGLCYSKCWLHASEETNGEPLTLAVAKCKTGNLQDHSTYTTAISALLHKFLIYTFREDWRADASTTIYCWNWLYSEVPKVPKCNFSRIYQSFFFWTWIPHFSLDGATVQYIQLEKLNTGLDMLFSYVEWISQLNIFWLFCLFFWPCY